MNYATSNFAALMSHPRPSEAAGAVTAAVLAPRASGNRLGANRRNHGIGVQRGRDYGVPMNNTSIAGVRIPDSNLALHDSKFKRANFCSIIFNSAWRE